MKAQLLLPFMLYCIICVQGGIKKFFSIVSILVFFQYFWTPSSSPSFRPSIFPSVYLSIFFELYHWLFLNFGMVLETDMKLCVKEPDFPGKFCLPPKMQKIGQKSHTWKNPGSWDMGQNALEFLNWVSLEQNDEKVWLLACCCRFIEIKSLWKNYWRRDSLKWVWPLWSQDTKVGCISRRNQ